MEGRPRPPDRDPDAAPPSDRDVDAPRRSDRDPDAAPPSNRDVDAPRRSDRDPDAALRRLEERLNRASQRAERLFAEAAQSARGTQSRESDSRAAGAHKPPPAGWQAPREEHGGSRGDLELLVQVIDSLRDLIPPELQRRLADAVREVLLAVRALIDWYLERTERSRREPADVEDIPIL